MLLRPLLRPVLRPLLLSLFAAGLVRSLPPPEPEPEDPLREIFVNGEAGYAFDPSDFSANFQDNAGTMPVTALEQICGLALDKRLGLERGPEILINGDFSAGSVGWNVLNADATHVATFSDGTLRYQSDTLYPSLIVQQAGNPLSASKFYEVTVVVSEWTSGTLRTDQIVALGGGQQQFGNGVGTWTFRGVGAGAVNFGITRVGENVDVTIKSISVRELPGNHACQATTTKRTKISARKNLITNSAMTGGGDTPAGGWTRPEASGSSVPAGLDADGNVIYRQTAVNQQPYFEQGGQVLGVPGRLTASLYVDAIHSGSVNVAALIGWRHAITATTQFLVDGVPVAGSTVAQAGTRISAVLTSTGTIGIVNPCFGAGVSVLATVDVSFSRPQVEVAAVPTRYQRTGVNAALGDYDANGFPVRYVYDGVDDALVIPSLNLSITDKVSISTGFQRRSDAAIGQVIHHGTGNVVGGLRMTSPTSAASSRTAFVAAGTSVSSATTALSAAPVSLVVTASADIAASRLTIRRNGVAEGSSTAALGTGNFASAAHGIGVTSSGSGGSFNGGISALVLYAGPTAATPEQIAAMEAWCNEREMAY